MRAGNSWIAFWSALVVTVGPVPTDRPLNLPPPASVSRTILNVSVSAAAALIRNLVTTPAIGAAIGKFGLNLLSAISTRVQGTGIGGFRHCVTLGLMPFWGVSVNGLPNVVAAWPTAGAASAPAATTVAATASLRKPKRAGGWLGGRCMLVCSPPVGLDLSDNPRGLEDLRPGRPAGVSGVGWPPTV